MSDESTSRRNAKRVIRPLHVPPDPLKPAVHLVCEGKPLTPEGAALKRQKEEQANKREDRR